mgnify:CR=1 FL=1
MNCKSRGKIKVAILSEPGFLAARHVDPSTVRAKPLPRYGKGVPPRPRR